MSSLVTIVAGIVYTVTRGSFIPSHEKKLGGGEEMKGKKMVINALVAALYIVVTLLIKPLAFGQVQFRISEMFNHLVVFNKKYFYGVVGGVFIANLLFSDLGPIDLVFGVAHSVVALSLTMVATKYVQSIPAKMVINMISFALCSFIVAWELVIAFNAPFWASYFFVALGEIVVMGLAIPLMMYVNKSVQFNKIIEK